MPGLAFPINRLTHLISIKYFAQLMGEDAWMMDFSMKEYPGRIRSFLRAANFCFKRLVSVRKTNIVQKTATSMKIEFKLPKKIRVCLAGWYTSSAGNLDTYICGPGQTLLNGNIFCSKSFNQILFSVHPVVPVKRHNSSASRHKAHHNPWPSWQTKI